MLGKFGVYDFIANLIPGLAFKGPSVGWLSYSATNPSSQFLVQSVTPHS